MSLQKRIAALLLALALFGAFRGGGPRPVELAVPTGWPAPTYDFGRNPLTKEGIALGRKLFYDPILSRDSTVTCASCHLSYTAFTHVDHARSHGIGDRVGLRNSPVLANLAWGKLLMWDGAVNHLDVQALAPIAHPDEMGEQLPNVIRKINEQPRYRVLFAQAFGDSTATGERLLKSIAQFMLTFVSAGSKYDRVMRGEAGAQFTEQERRGLDLFRRHCASCHAEPLFTDHGFAHNGLPLDTALNDFGRMRITGRREDSLLFKVPTLRNIEFSHPYMHDGRFKKLSQVLNHYAREVREGPTLAAQLRGGIPLSPEDKVDLTAFLLTLSDRDFLFDPELAFLRE
jgi:cytochrome c peroxidase